ncbi:MAG: hypothetical protein IT564_11620 [Rhodospirillales bacterium]|nr:hypothetical protein [Rhodospirillales bacterium]
MERYELTLLIETLDYLEKHIQRADERERPLTHGQKHYILQTSLIVIRDLRADFERQRNLLDNPHKDDGIPF